MAKVLKNRSNFILFAGIICAGFACEKTTTAPSVSGVAAFTVVNVIPNDIGVIPVVNTSQTIMWFINVNPISYGNYFEYSPIWGNDTVYVVQSDDTLAIGPKATGEMFYSILPLKNGGIYSLFLCGADTASPDYLFTTDTLPYHSPTDSTVGIRFVNLSAGSNPISVNLSGSPNGSEVSSLSYKGITGFKNYLSNSSVTNSIDTFVIRDAATGDSLTSYILYGVGTGNGVGFVDLNSNLLVFKNVTIAIYGLENNNNNPLSAMLIDDY